MISNLTEYQLEVANWLAHQYKQGNLPETFSVHWKTVEHIKTAKIKEYKGKQIEITYAALQILETEGLIQTIDKEIFDPPKPEKPKKINRLAPSFSYPAKKWESGRKYTLRNDIFQAQDLYVKRQLKNDAEKILEFLIAHPSAARPETMTALQMSDESYEVVCQFLESVS